MVLTAFARLVTLFLSGRAWAEKISLGLRCEIISWRSYSAKIVTRQIQIRALVRFRPEIKRFLEAPQRHRKMFALAPPTFTG
jgi:hypothetical protein